MGIALLQKTPLQLPGEALAALLGFFYGKRSFSLGFRPSRSITGCSNERRPAVLGELSGKGFWG